MGGRLDDESGRQQDRSGRRDRILPRSPSIFTDVIHGCLSSTGTLRVIDSAETKCKTTEKSLTWNQKGQRGATGAAGPAGPAGARGPAGPAGAPRPAGVSGYKIRTDSTILSPGDSRGRQVYCDTPSDNTGLVPVGGGYQAPPDSFRADENYPQISSDGFAGWTVFGQNISSQSITLIAYVICARVGP
jgi:hypothetical protein